MSAAEREEQLAVVAMAMYPAKAIDAIAKELGVSRKVIRRLLRSRDVQIVHGGRRERADGEHSGKGVALTAADHDLIVEAGRAGGTLREIATRVRERGLQISDSTLRNHLRTADITPAPGKPGPVAKPRSTEPVEHSPSVAAWIATCGPCRTRIGVSESTLAGVVRRLASQDSLTARQAGILAAARANLAATKERSRTCPDCNSKVVTA